MANTPANTSIYKADLSGFKKPIGPSKPQGNQNYSASSYLNNAPAFQQVAMGMAKWNSPQAETQARSGGSSKSSSSAKSILPTLPNKSTLPTPPSTKRSSSVYTPPVPAIPGANPLDELYKRTPPPIKAELEAPKVATTTTPVIDLTKKQNDVYTPANYDFIDNMDIKGLKNLQRSFQYDIQTGKTLTKDQQLQMLYAQDRIGDLTTQQTLENPINPMIEQQQQAKIQRQAELEAEQNKLIASQQENERQYIESQNILFKQAEEEQKKVMGYILGGQGAETSSYGAEQLNKIGMNFAGQKQSLLAESNARIQKYRAELSGATREELDNYDKNIQQLQLQSAQFDFDNLKAINEYNVQEGKDLMSKFGALYETSLLQEKQKTPLTQEEIAQAGYYSNFLVKADGSLDNNVLELLQKTNPLLINSAVQQGIAIQKERMSKGGDYSFANLGGGQIAVQDPKTGQVTFIQGNKQNEYDYQKDTAGNIYAVNKNDPSDTRIVVSQPSEGMIGDLTYLRSQFPTEARSGTNNPAGITWNAGFDQGTGTAKILADNGIVFEKGNPRPKGEGGNYVKFRTMDDGLKAQRLIMTQTYGNNTVQEMLNKRVGTGNVQYAKDIAQNAGIDLNVKVNSLNETDLDILQSAKIQRESPGLYKVLSGITQGGDTQPNPNNFPQYANYIESGKLPAGMKDNSPQADTFKSQALEGYLMNKEQELNGMGLTISNPMAFSSTVTNTPKRKAINEALSIVPAFKNTMDQLINITRKYGTELIPSNAKRQMSMLVRDAQLQAKEIYNLGVLNGPDLSLMEAIIGNPTERTAKINQGFGLSYVDTLEKAKQKILDNAYTQANAIGLSTITDTTTKTTPTQPNTDFGMLANPNNKTTTTTEVNSYLQGLGY